MSGFFNQLLAFFGITNTAPSNFAEFIPWFFSVMVCLGVFLYLWDFMGDVLRSLNMHRW